MPGSWRVNQACRPGRLAAISRCSASATPARLAARNIAAPSALKPLVTPP
jgi:hypothetical protein